MSESLSEMQIACSIPDVSFMSAYHRENLPIVGMIGLPRCATEWCPCARAGALHHHRRDAEQAAVALGMPKA